MRLVFMGTPDFAVPSLRVLFEEHEIAAVVTQPDKPAGRGRKLAFSDVKLAALELGIEVLQPEKVKNKAFIERLAAYQPDIIAVAAYGQILPQSILDIPKYGCVNVHGSLLPKYRGASPVQAALLNGDKLAGATIMKMEKGLDCGDIILQESFIIEETDNAGTLFDKTARVGASLLVRALQLIEVGNAVFTPQNDALASYAPKITKDTGRIDFTRDSREIINLVRAMNPWPGAYVYINDDHIKVWAAEIAEHCGAAGSVISTRGGLLVSCGNGGVLLTELQAANSRRMRALDFVNGYKQSITCIT